MANILFSFIQFIQEACLQSPHRLSVLQTKMNSDGQKSSASNLLMLLPLSSPPFNFSQISTLKPNFQLLSNIRRSIISNLDKCIQLLHHISSHNGGVSLSSHIITSFQKIPRRNCQKLDMLSNQNFAAILPGDSVAGIVVANGILNFLSIYNTLLVVRLVLTWFPNAPPAVVSPLSTICDPYLNIFRGIIPPLGGTLDLSPILAFLVLNAFTSTASALPAELPPTEVSSEDNTFQTTASRKKWMRRIAANKSTRSNDEI